MARGLSASMLKMLRDIRDLPMISEDTRTLDALVRRGLVEITGYRSLSGITDVRLLASGRDTLLELERE